MEKLSTPATDVNPGEIKQESEIKNTDSRHQSTEERRRIGPTTDAITIAILRNQKIPRVPIRLFSKRNF
jgi:hypothetical protein